MMMLKEPLGKIFQRLQIHVRLKLSFIAREGVARDILKQAVRGNLVGQLRFLYAFSSLD